jgi:hypothetical protein
VIHPRVKPGVYYVIGCADDTELVVEEDEADNCRASSTTLRVLR